MMVEAKIVKDYQSLCINLTFALSNIEQKKKSKLNFLLSEKMKIIVVGRRC